MAMEVMLITKMLMLMMMMMERDGGSDDGGGDDGSDVGVMFRFVCLVFFLINFFHRWWVGIALVPQCTKRLVR